MPGRCAPAAPTVRGGGPWTMSQNSQSLCIVDDKVPTARPDEIQVLNDRRRAAGCRAQSIRHDDRTAVEPLMPAQEISKCSRVMSLEIGCRYSLCAHALYAPTGNRISSCIHIDTYRIRSEHLEDIPENVQGRCTKRRPFTSQQADETLRDALSTRRRLERRRTAGGQLRPGPQRLGGMAQTQVECRGEVEHGCFALTSLPHASAVVHLWAWVTRHRQAPPTLMCRKLVQQEENAGPAAH